MTNFKNVQEKYEYAIELMNSGAAVILAEKSGCVFARKADAKGEYITVYTSNGTEEVKQEFAPAGAWILTRATLDGKVVLNAAGKPNSWVPKAGVFEKKYDVANMRDDGFTKPKGGVQKFVRISEDIAIMVPWGENGALIPQNLEAGSVLNVTNLDDIYGIAEIEFSETYEIV